MVVLNSMIQISLRPQPQNRNPCFYSQQGLLVPLELSDDGYLVKNKISPATNPNKGKMTGAFLYAKFFTLTRVHGRVSLQARTGGLNV